MPTSRPRRWPGSSRPSKGNRPPDDLYGMDGPAPRGQQDRRSAGIVPAVAGGRMRSVGPRAGTNARHGCPGRKSLLPPMAVTPTDPFWFHDILYPTGTPYDMSEAANAQGLQRGIAASRRTMRPRRRDAARPLRETATGGLTDVLESDTICFRRNDTTVSGRNVMKFMQICLCRSASGHRGARRRAGAAFDRHRRHRRGSNYPMGGGLAEVIKQQRGRLLGDRRGHRRFGRETWASSPRATRISRSRWPTRCSRPTTAPARFEGQQLPMVRGLASMYANMIHIVALEDSGGHVA